MANYQTKLVLRPELVLRSRSYPRVKVTYYNCIVLNLTIVTYNYSQHFYDL